MKRSNLSNNKAYEMELGVLINNKLSKETSDSQDEESDVDDPKISIKSTNLSKDYKNIALLMFLYLLQGLPLGLTGSLPYILSSRKVSYADQGTFSFAFWPFSMKLLWAPLVDSLFIKSFGRRKSWLIPVQYAIGIFMIMFSDYANNLIETHDGSNSSYNIYTLTLIFFMFTFLAATQDIVVDGWALTMLSRENVAWASTCNSVGQTAGWFIGNVLFLTLESDDFSNNYIRPVFGLDKQKYGVVTLDSFMHFFGILFIVSTTLVMLFKKEKSFEDEEKKTDEKKKINYEDNLSVVSTYKLMWRLVWIAPVKKLIIILLTMKIGFATESMTVLKLIERGVAREKLGLLAIPLTPLQIILPLVISKYSNGPEPLTLLLRAIPLRLIMSGVSCLWVYLTPYFRDTNGLYPLGYYVGCFLISAINSIFMYSMFVTQVSFFAKVSDKKIGGTYMTFLNTVSNFGGNWPNTCALYLASYLTFKNCFYNLNTIHSSIHTDANDHANNVTRLLNVIDKNHCKTDEESSECVTLGGYCVTRIDAYYLETFVCILLGFMWILWKRNLTYKLQYLSKSTWKIPEEYIQKLMRK